MACSDELVIPEEVPRKEQRVKGKKFAREIHTEKMCKALVVVIEALETKNKASGSREAMAVGKNQTERSVEALLEALGALVETGKKAVAIEPERSVGGLVEAAIEIGEEEVAVDRSQTERCSARVKKIFQEWEFVGDEFFEDTDGEVDEEELKLVAKLQDDLTRMWDDCVNRLIEGGVEFADPSDPHCLVAC